MKRLGRGPGVLCLGAIGAVQLAFSIFDVHPVQGVVNHQFLGDSHC